MAKSNLQPIAISVLETQASTKKLDCQKKWLAVQNVVDQVCIVGFHSIDGRNFRLQAFSFIGDVHLIVAEMGFQLFNQTAGF